MDGTVRCPDCGGALRVVPRSPLLNEDQWDSVKAGDYYCETCPDNGRGKSGLHYVWRHEALTPAAVSTSAPARQLAGGQMSDKAMTREEREAVERAARKSARGDLLGYEDGRRLADAARRYLALTAPPVEGGNFEDSDGGPLPAEPTPPVAPCIACAHVLPLACWDERFREMGICAECLRLAAPNRGNCSHTRGCDCTQDGVSWRIRDAESASDASDKRAEGPGGEG